MVLASPKYVVKVQMNRFHMQTEVIELKTFKYKSSYNLSYNQKRNKKTQKILSNGDC